MNIATLEIHSLKELLVLRKTVQDRMALLQAAQDTMPYSRGETIEYLTLGQILVRLPEPALLTPQVCTEADIQIERYTVNNQPIKDEDRGYVGRYVDRKPSEEELAIYIYTEEKNLHGGTIDEWENNRDRYTIIAKKVLDNFYHVAPQSNPKYNMDCGYYIACKDGSWITKAKVAKAINSTDEKLIQAIINAIIPAQYRQQSETPQTCTEADISVIITEETRL